MRGVSVTNKDPVSNKRAGKRQYLRLSSDLHTDTVTLYTHLSDTHIPCTHIHTDLKIYLEMKIVN